MTSSSSLELPERPCGAMPDVTARKFYTPDDLAGEVGLSPQIICGYLRRLFPGHDNKAHWRLDKDRFEFVAGAIRDAQQTHPARPSYGLATKTQPKQSTFGVIC